MEKQEFTITVYTENQVGLLHRITTIFTKEKLTWKASPLRKAKSREFIGLLSLLQRPRNRSLRLSSKLRSKSKY